MSWLATKYAWKCRNEKVKGSVRLVLLAVALRVRKNGITTVPTSLGALSRLTFLSDDTITRCLRTLDLAGEVKLVPRGKTRGKNAVYALPKMAGPLFAVGAEETRNLREFVDDPEAGESPQVAANQHRKMRGHFAGFSGAPAGGVISSQGVRTQVLEEDEDHPPHPPTVTEFCAWWERTYPRYHHGAQSRLSRADVTLVAGLIERRTVDRLQHMAIVLWQATGESGARWAVWLVKQPRTRNVALLNHLADDIDASLARYPAWWLACPHAVKCDAEAACAALHEEAVNG